jgi:hypothetical protein
MSEFITPNARFDPDHLTNQGRNAPSCSIKLWIQSPSGNGDPDGIEVEVGDRDTGATIAHGKVMSSDTSKLHELAVTDSRSLQEIRAAVTFRSGDTQKQGPSGRIWIRCP